VQSSAALVVTPIRAPRPPQFCRAGGPRTPGHRLAAVRQRPAPSCPPRLERAAARGEPRRPWQGLARPHSGRCARSLPVGDHRHGARRVQRPPPPAVRRARPRAHPAPAHARRPGVVPHRTRRRADGGRAADAGRGRGRDRARCAVRVCLCPGAREWRIRGCCDGGVGCGGRWDGREGEGAIEARARIALSPLLLQPPPSVPASPTPPA